MIGRASFSRWRPLAGEGARQSRADEGQPRTLCLHLCVESGDPGGQHAPYDVWIPAFAPLFAGMSG
jgi:hypothetical protein